MTPDTEIAQALLTGQPGHLWERGVTPETVRAELAGRNVACPCAPGELCHGDTLIEVANQPAQQTDSTAEQEKRDA